MLSLSYLCGEHGIRDTCLVQKVTYVHNVHNVQMYITYVHNFAVIFRETQQNPVLLNVQDFNSLRNSKFNKNHPTKIVIHGFGGGRNLAPSTDLRDGKTSDLLIFYLNYVLFSIRVIEISLSDNGNNSEYN